MTNQSWIDIEDQLPQKDGMYLICAQVLGDKPFINTAWFNPDFGWSLLPTLLIDAISHWMPLPGPPETSKMKVEDED